MKLDPETGKKICSRCKEVKTADDFTVSRRRPDGLDITCRTCNGKKSVQYRENNRDNPEYTQRRQNFNLRWSKNNPEAKLWYNCKARASRKSLPFTITKNDICIPDVCPVCARPVISGAGENVGKSANSPSVDMYDPRLGYTPDNTWVICDRCNSRKQDMTGEEHIAFGQRLIEAREKSLAAVLGG